MVFTEIQLVFAKSQFSVICLLEGILELFIHSFQNFHCRYLREAAEAVKSDKTCVGFPALPQILSV